MFYLGTDGKYYTMQEAVVVCGQEYANRPFETQTKLLMNERTHRKIFGNTFVKSQHTFGAFNW